MTEDWKEASFMGKNRNQAIDRVLERPEKSVMLVVQSSTFAIAQSGHKNTEFRSIIIDLGYSNLKIQN